MKRLALGALALGFAMGTAASAFACDKDKAGCDKSAATASAKGCHGKAATAAAGGDVVDAGVARVMEMMPKMAYKVGDLETPCCYTAKAKAEESNQPIAYIVAGESYTNRAEAMDKLAELITAELQNITQVAYVVDGEIVHCPKAAAETAAAKNVESRALLAGVEFDSAEDAQAVATQLTEKMKEHRAAQASAGGCSKSAASSGCSKGAAETAAAKSGCCGKSKEAAPAETAQAEVSGAQVAEADETPALAHAKRMVREIVEFVATHRAS